MEVSYSSLAHSIAIYGHASVMYTYIVISIILKTTYTYTVPVDPSQISPLLLVAETFPLG